jgi:hypothetical protein
MSVVSAKLKSNERKTMLHKYNPTPQEMRDAYSVAYGDMGDTMLLGSLFGYLSVENKDALEVIYAEALEKVGKDLVEKGL